MKHKQLTLTGLNKLAKDISNKIGPQFRIFGLIGQLGAGKTAFTKQLARHMGLSSVKSPTFTIVNCYQKKGQSLYHIDLYRLEKSEELAHIGLDEIINDESNVVVIEWVEKFPAVLKQCHATLSFKINQNQTRDVEIKTF